MFDDLEIPDFLKRSLDEKRKPFVEHKPREKKLTPKEELARDIERITDRRWRQWLPSPETGHNRPRKSAFRKQVRAELKRRDKTQAAKS